MRLRGDQIRIATGPAQLPVQVEAQPQGTAESSPQWQEDKELQTHLSFDPVLCWNLPYGDMQRSQCTVTRLGCL